MFSTKGGIDRICRCHRRDFRQSRKLVDSERNGDAQRMPSRSLISWQTRSRTQLDEIEAAHAAVGGVGPGRRSATQQINQAFAVLLSSQFQRFCRDLHSEAADHLTASVFPTLLRNILRAQLVENRKLDTGNPNPGNLGSDFGRLGIQFWATVIAQDPRNAARRARLEKLNRWRNAIAHQDFDPSVLGGRTQLALREVRNWRTACEALAEQFDRAIAVYIATIIGTRPW
jgi:hypothetical protein